jgi:hypothetical protein
LGIYRGTKPNSSKLEDKTVLGNLD